MSRSCTGARPLGRTAGPFTTVAAALAMLLGACTGTSGGQVETAATTAPGESSAPTTATSTVPDDCARQLPPAAQAGQLIMVMVTAPQVATDHLGSGRVGGFGLKGRQSAAVGDEVATAVSEAPIAPFVAGDEEGGTVQRLGAALGSLSGAETLAQGAPSDAGQILGNYAEGMAGLGFDMNFAPVADVGSGSDLGSRTFGGDPSTVAEFVEAIVAAQGEAGITSVVKHWPGIGGGDNDPHVELSELAPLSELRESDLTVFDRAIAAGAPAIMVAHATVEGLTDDGEPTSLSRAAITDELRGRQGFDGLVVTDSLGMGAVVNTVPQDEATERSIAAGADVALLSGTEVVEASHLRLSDAIMSGRIPEPQVTESVRRVLRLKGVDGPCPDVAARFSALQDEVAAQLGSDAAQGPDGEGAGMDDGAGQDGTGTGSSAVTDSGINDADQGVNGSGSGEGSGTGSGSGTGNG